MTFTNLEKYVYSKKCLKQRRQFRPFRSKVSVWTIVVTNGLIKFCKKIKESTSYAKCRSLFVVAVW